MEIVAIILIVFGFLALWLLFRSSGVKKEYLPKVKETDFVIEYYPLTYKYFVKYKSRYLQENYITGIYDLKSADLFMYASSFKTEQEARKAIQKFKETNFKDNVKYIKVD